MGSLTKKLKKAPAKRLKTMAEAYAEGYEAGKKDSYRKGRIDGAADTINLFCDALETLQTVPDIGPKRYRKILNHLGYLDQMELSKDNRWRVEAKK
jgi:flagellar biosynthesis/type III secretory pathway protein FliH